MVSVNPEVVQKRTDHRTKGSRNSWLLLGRSTFPFRTVVTGEVLWRQYRERHKTSHPVCLCRNRKDSPSTPRSTKYKTELQLKRKSRVLGIRSLRGGFERMTGRTNRVNYREYGRRSVVREWANKPNRTDDEMVFGLWQEVGSLRHLLCLRGRGPRRSGVPSVRHLLYK